MEIKNDPKIQEWFEMIDASEGTIKLYTFYMTKFCECVNLSPSQLIEESIKEIKQGLLPAERKSPSYISKFKKCLAEKNSAPKTVSLAISTLKSFFKAFDIQLPSSIKIRKARLLKENNNFIEKEDIIKLVKNAQSLRDRAIIQCMATSGMARNEIRNLRFGDIKFDPSGIGIINVRRKKSQTDYVTFIGPEAVAALQTYLEERNRNQKLKVKGDSDYIFVTYQAAVGATAGSQISNDVMTYIFSQLAKELGYSNGKFLIKTRSHALRKFFASTLENAGMPKNKIDFMLGHTQSGTDMAYFRTDIEALKHLYIKFLPYLTFEKTIEVRSLDTEDAKRLEELEKENEKLKAVIPEIQKAYEELIMVNEEKDQAFRELVKRGEKMDSLFQKLLSCFPDNIKMALINGKPMNEENFMIIPVGKKELEEPIERGKQQKKVTFLKQSGINQEHV
jgi:integrase